MSDDLIETVARAICCNGPCQAVALNERAKTDANHEPWHCLRAQYADKARAAIAAIEASGTHRVVPVEPTDAMELAGEPYQTPLNHYRAMVAAAPKVIP